MKRTILFFTTICLCFASFFDVEGQQRKRKSVSSVRSGVTVVTVDAKGREIKRQKSKQVVLAIEGVNENGALVLRQVDPKRTKLADERQGRDARRKANRVKKKLT